MGRLLHHGRPRHLLSSDPSFDCAGTFGLFSFASPIGPAVGDFLVRGFDYNAGTVSENAGMIATPSAVPEPSGLVLGVLVAGCIVASRRARRPRTS